jgi:hypothetical protein
MKKPLLVALAAFASIALLAVTLGCGLWWGWQYLHGVRTARGDVSLAIPFPVLCMILLECVGLGGLAARSAFLRSRRRAHDAALAQRPSSST